MVLIVPYHPICQAESPPNLVDFGSISWEDIVRCTKLWTITSLLKLLDSSIYTKARSFSTSEAMNGCTCHLPPHFQAESWDCTLNQVFCLWFVDNEVWWLWPGTTNKGQILRCPCNLYPSNMSIATMFWNISGAVDGSPCTISFHLPCWESPQNLAFWWYFLSRFCQMYLTIDYHIPPEASWF